MQIVFVGPFGLQPKGTMSVRALPLAKALVARGHTVTMLIPPWDDPERSRQRWTTDGVAVVNLPLPPPIAGFFEVELTRRLVIAALQLQPEVVHCFKPKAFAGLTHVALWSWRKVTRFLKTYKVCKLVVDADDWEQAWNQISPYSALQKRFFTWQEEWGLRQADAVTTASRALTQLVYQERGDKNARCGFAIRNVSATDYKSVASAEEITQKIFYLPNGYQANTVTADSSAVEAIRQQWQLGDAPTILLYSRFWEFRLSRVVKLVQTVATQCPTARWLMVGRGLQGEDETLRTMLAEANLSHYVRFVGWVAAEQSPAYFQAADIAIHPYDDTLINRTKCSVKLIDLLSAGLPVVADGVGQNGEYIQNGVSGMLVTAEDDGAFGEAIIQLLQQPELRRAMGLAARQYIKANFSWSQLAQVAEQAYLRADEI